MPHDLIKAIDVHGHYGTYHRPELSEQLNQFMSAGPSVVRDRVQQTGIQWTIVSPLRGIMPRGLSIAEVENANQETADYVEHVQGLLQYVIVDPRRPATFDQARTMLRNHRCVGIKIHGEWHEYYLENYGDALFALAAECQAVVLAHSGDKRTMPQDFLVFADRYPEITFILAHLGHT